MSDGLRVLVADDERPAREKLRRFLEDSPSVARVFEACNGKQALEVVISEHPDVVFLDIGMPTLDGVSVAESIVGSDGPHIVFVTAYDEHAIRAFELGAADYLLKPFDRERFDRALDRVEKAVFAEHEATDDRDVKRTLRALVHQATPIARVLVEDGARTRLLAVKDIIRLTADGNYVRVSTASREFRIRVTMSQLEERLPKDTFVRMNRSQIVNLDCVSDFAPAGHGDLDVRMTDGSTVRLSRRYRNRLDDLWK